MFDSMKGVSWGSVILGAAAVVALVALGPAAGLIGAMEGIGLSAGMTYAAAATVGGVVGNMVSKLGHRAQDATTTLVGR